MNLSEYFEKATGMGILATSDSAGAVNAAVYAKPHFIDEETVAFIMADKLTHHNIEQNPRAAYLFKEAGEKYVGKAALPQKDEGGSGSGSRARDAPEEIPRGRRQIQRREQVHRHLQDRQGPAARGGQGIRQGTGYRARREIFTETLTGTLHGVRYEDFHDRRHGVRGDDACPRADGKRAFGDGAHAQGRACPEPSGRRRGPAGGPHVAWGLAGAGPRTRGLHQPRRGHHFHAVDRRGEARHPRQPHPHDQASRRGHGAPQGEGDASLQHLRRRVLRLSRRRGPDRGIPAWDRVPRHAVTGLGSRGPAGEGLRCPRCVDALRDRHGRKRRDAGRGSPGVPHVPGGRSRERQPVALVDPRDGPGPHLSLSHRGKPDPRWPGQLHGARACPEP